MKPTVTVLTAPISGCMLWAQLWVLGWRWRRDEWLQYGQWEGVLLLRSHVLETERKAMCTWHQDGWMHGVKGMRVGTLQLDQNYKPGCPVSLLESLCLPGLSA